MMEEFKGEIVIFYPEQQKITVIDQTETNEKVLELEKIILETPQIILKTTNLIHGGIYARTVFIPAGLVATGVLSKIDNMCIVQGDITVTTKDGLKRFTGYNVIPAYSGAKRAAVTHADTYWTTLIHTNQTEVSAAEAEFTDEVDLLQTRNSNLLDEGDTKCLTP